MAKDFFGQTIKEGDTVVCIPHCNTSEIPRIEHIERIMNKTVILKGGRRKAHNKIAKVNTFSEMFMLKVAHIDDTEYKPIGLFPSIEVMEEGKADYLKKMANGLNMDDYRFTFERHPVVWYNEAVRR